MGTLESIDDIGTFHVKWDNGRGLGLVLGEDRFSVLPPPLQTLKLYMPITAGYFDEDGECEEEVTMDPHEAAEYAPQIIAALQKERTWLEQESPEAAERGLMAYFHGPDSVDQKVKSCFFTAEVRDGQLWGVAECKVQGQLTPEELDCLMDNVGGQASDGLGESFEQREISVGGGLEIYAHLWQDSGWSIMPEQDRFDPHFSERLPDMCLSTLPSDGTLICIKQGENGYFTSDWNTGSPERNRRIADYHNQKRGISQAQEQAMLNGSMFGWDCPAVDPRNYSEQGTPQMGGIML